MSVSLVYEKTRHGIQNETDLKDLEQKPTKETKVFLRCLSLLLLNFLILCLTREKNRPAGGRSVENMGRGAFGGTPDAATGTVALPVQSGSPTMFSTEQQVARSTRRGIAAVSQTIFLGRR
jgi:hypothetical protein